MPKKSQIIDIPVLDVSESEEEEEIVTEIVPKAKAKRPVTAEQKAHLDKIRVKALEVKAAQKEITLKAKLSKSIEKNEAAKKYDDYIAQKPIPAPEPAPVISVPNVPQRKIKKVIYEDEEDNENLNYMLYMQNQQKLQERMLSERIKHTCSQYENAMTQRRY